jgi:hypothetical protein
VEIDWAAWARGEVKIMAGIEPKRGMTFPHARHIIGSPKAGTARPSICTVTRVTQTAVYYRSESGNLWNVDRDNFASVVKISKAA